MEHDGPPRHLHPVDHDDPPVDPWADQPPQPTTQPASPNSTSPGASRPTDPPQDRGAERAVLGALLAEPTLGHTLAPELQPDDFYWPHHAELWTTWHHLAATSEQPPDKVTLNAHYVDQAATSPGRPDRLTLDVVHLLADLTANLTEVCPQPHAAPTYARTVRDKARARAFVDAGTRMVQLGQAADLDRLDHYLGEALQTLDDAATRYGPTTTHTSTWAALDLEPVLAGHEVDPPPALLARTDAQNLLYAGAVHTFSGEPGSGKTWVTLIAALQQLAAGHTVTMIDFEDRASRVIGRLLALGAHPTQIREHFRYVRPHAALDHHTTADLDTATRGTTLVILDGVTEAMTLHGLDLSSNPDVARFYALLPRRIADHGPAVAMIDHVVKDGEKQGRWGIGGQHKLAGIDGAAYLVQAIEKFGRGKTGTARITVAKDRPGYIEEVAIGRTVAELLLDATDVNCLRHQLRPPTALATDESGNMRPTHLMERVSRYVEVTPGLSKRELIDGRISGKNAYLRRAIDRLIQEGYIEVATGANRKQSHRSITPFREDEDAMHENPKPTSGWADEEPLQ